MSPCWQWLDFVSVLVIISHCQISQAFKLLGMKASDSSCVAVTVGETRLTDMQNIIEAMPGCEVLPFTDNISKYNSIPAIKKVCHESISVNTEG